MPVVILAIAAPAAAASGPSAGAMFFNNYGSFVVNTGTVTVNIGVRFQVPGAPTPLTLNGLTLTLSLPTSRFGPNFTVPATSGWTFAMGAASGGFRQFTATWVGVLTQGTNLAMPNVTFTDVSGSGASVAATLFGTDSAGNSTAVVGQSATV